MSLHEYKTSTALCKLLDVNEIPFYALIMAAMRQADTENCLRLRSLFPDVWVELQARYDAAGGVLPSESAYNA